MKKWFVVFFIALFSSTMTYADCSKQVIEYMTRKYSSSNTADKVETITQLKDVNLGTPSPSPDGGQTLFLACYSVETEKRTLGTPQEWTIIREETRYTADVLVDSSSCEVLKFVAKVLPH